MSSPLVSVVIPTYNQPALLAETLESVFKQTLTDYEVVVVNDGSTDDTEERLKVYGDRIRLITQPNGGIGAARNRGLDEAKGKYIALLDHDDLWHPEKLAVQVDMFQRHPECAGVGVPYAYSTAPDRCAYDLSIRDEDWIVRKPLQKYAAGNMFILSSALMIDRDKTAGLRYETQRHCIEDLALQLRLLTRGAFAIAGKGILAIYRMHGENNSSSATHFYNGMKLLRKIESSGGFEPLSPEDRLAVRQFIAFFGRISTVKQALAGFRLRGLASYLREFPHQARLGRYKFLATYPGLLMMPNSMLRRRWSGNVKA